MKKLYFVLLIIASVCTQAQNHVEYLGQVQYPVRSSSLTRYVDDEGNEYALIGTYDGTDIVDITDPTAPVSLFYVPGPAGIWREMKTYDHHAYITNETEGGLQIIDLTDMPASVSDHFLTEAGDDTLDTGHTIFIDENGYAYVFGANIDGGGAVIFDLNADPDNPPKVGAYSDNYIHDGYVRNDTLWAGFIYTGQAAAIDVSDKANPVLLAEVTTPSAFTHNCWTNDAGNVLFTTDEKADAYVTSYDVSDLSDIKELGRFQSHPGSGVIDHNVYVVGDYLVIAYYRDGVVIVDATKSDNMVEVGNYDTSPFEPAGMFNGCWGVDPYLPSGNIIASDIEEGLFILQPDYHRASYIEGTIMDDINLTAAINAKVEIMSTDNFDLTNLTGVFKTGTSEAGIYDIRISKEGCYTKIIPDVELIAGETYELEASVSCTLLVDASDIEAKLEVEAFPNVFQQTTHISYHLPDETASAVLQVYDAAGNSIQSIPLAGKDGSFDFGEMLSSGMYIMKLVSDNADLKTFRVIKS